MVNRTRLQYNMGTDMIEITGSKRWLVNFYQEQLIKFKRVGMNKKTEFDVKVTPRLIAITEKRLNELTTVYDGSLTPQAMRLRKMRAKRLNEKGQLNGHETNGNGAATAQSCEDNSNTGHETGRT